MFCLCTSARCNAHQQNHGVHWKWRFRIDSQKFSSPDSSCQMKQSLMFVEHFIEIILWSLGSVETWSRHSNQEFKKIPGTALLSLEVLQNHSSMKPMTQEFVSGFVFLGDSTVTGCSFLWSSGTPQRLLQERPQFAVTAWILGGVLMKPLLCDTLSALFNIKNSFLHMICALMPKIPHFPKAKANKVFLQAGLPGSCLEDGAGEASCWGILAGERWVRHWLSHGFSKAKDCEIDRSEEFVLHIILNYVSLFVYFILLVKTTNSCLWVRKVSPQGTKSFNYSE